MIISLTTTVRAASGRWQYVINNIGIAVMHMWLYMYDRTDFGPSNLTLPNGECIEDPKALVMKKDCSAHSAVYNITNNTIRPLTVKFDFWCSSGAMNGDVVLVQTSCNFFGGRVMRKLYACPTCEWQEIEDGLATPCWYATDHVLLDGRQIIVGDRGQPNYEFYHRPGISLTVFGGNDENNLYPFVFLNVDGNLLLFANNRAILYDYIAAKVIRVFPTFPGGDPRSYPSTCSTVLLPLNLTQNYIEVEILICDGAPRGSFSKARDEGVFWEVLNTCGRMSITNPDPKWTMETMPTGGLLLINGASKGTAGWELGLDPVLNLVLYLREKPIGSRFQIQTPDSTPRMYHSTAVLVPDGRVIVKGINPQDKYEFSNVLYPTELSVEAFPPDYLDSSFDSLRPTIEFPAPHFTISYGEKRAVVFSLGGGKATRLGSFSLTMVSPSFNTHSFSMNLRLLILSIESVKDLGASKFQVIVNFPDSKTLASVGFYMLFVVHEGILSPAL
ncbi:PREDICTED: uncharacterized protein LOC101306599 [Fragaria vesca subsp. vesca]